VKDLLIATHNRDKVVEIRQALEGLPYRILSADDLEGELPEVIEDGETLLANAQKKARSGAKHTGLMCVADDTGLEVDALEGAPGVYSARYAGESASYADNCQKLISEMAGKEDRKAVFRTVLVVAEPGGREDWVEGRCEGTITETMQGEGGFGYDPVFSLPNKGKTFAEMTLEEKNEISHRGLALANLRPLLDRW
jgi:XTP/dITP diphosphohydrolase